MSLEGIREAYASIYNNQEQEVLDENVLNYLGNKFKKGAQQIGGFIGRAGNAGSLGTSGEALGARDPGKDPVPAPAPRTVRGQGNRELRRPGDPGRTSQPTTRIKPNTPATTPSTPSSLGDAGTGSGSSPTPTPPKDPTPKDNMAGASKEARMAAFAKANPQLAIAAAEKARIRGTAQSDNPLLNRMKLRSGMRAGTPTVQDPKVQSLGKGNQSLKNNRYAGRSPLMNDNRDAYDMVLDYLLSEGHADTVEEAHYIMMQLDQEHIQEVVEAYVVTNADKMGNTKAYQNYKAGMKNKVTGKPLYVAAPHLKGV